MSEKREVTLFDLARYLNNTDCSRCIFANVCEKERLDCLEMIMSHTDVVNDGVVKWCVEHPAPTRQSEFLKMFPEAPLDDNNTLMIYPCYFDKEYDKKRNSGACCESCDKCRKCYWEDIKQ